MFLLIPITISNIVDDREGGQANFLLIRCKLYSCMVIQDVQMLPLPPLYPRLRVPTFQ